MDYYNFTQGYEWYDLIFILAAIASLYILKNDDPVFLAPIAFFIGNCIFLIFMRLVERRYLINLDVLLILQMVLGLSCWMRRNYYAKRSLSDTEPEYS